MSTERLLMDKNYQVLLALVRKALYGVSDTGVSNTFEGIESGEWKEIYKTASFQGVLPLLWDVVKDLPLDKSLRFNWALNVEKVEKLYSRQLSVLEEINALFKERGMDMMVIKGYGLSLLYPVPNHRPCGDIDFYLYGDYAKGDKVLEETHNLTTDLNHHHHTVNYYKGVMLENHYDFVNIESHTSNKIVEQRLIDAVQRDKGEMMSLPSGGTFHIPSPEFNALFLLRHAASHFAAERIGLRHLIDWVLFVNRYGDRVDWRSLYEFSKEMNMDKFLHCINVISVKYLGVNPSVFKDVQELSPFGEMSNPLLEERVLMEILEPEFKIPMPKVKGTLGNLFIMIPWKFRRWWKNRWKNKIVYRESLVGQFFVLWMSHIFKPTLK